MVVLHLCIQAINDEMSEFGHSYFCNLKCADLGIKTINFKLMEA